MVVNYQRAENEPTYTKELDKFQKIIKSLPDHLSPDHPHWKSKDGVKWAKKNRKRQNYGKNICTTIKNTNAMTKLISFFFKLTIACAIIRHTSQKKNLHIKCGRFPFNQTKLNLNDCYTSNAFRSAIRSFKNRLLYLINEFYFATLHLV